MDAAARSTTAVIAVTPDAGLLFGLMLVAAIVGGYAARWVHIPRVVGFLLAGVALRAGLQALLPQDESNTSDKELAVAAAHLSPIKDLALGLILFTIGGVFERSRLRATSARVLKISSLEIVLSIVFVFIGCATVALISQSTHPVVDNLMLALLLALAAIATAPAATLFVLQEYDAKGPITDTILGLTGVNNFVCIVLFYSTFLILAKAGLIQAPEALSQHLWFSLTVTVLGSIALGIVCGALVSITHAKLPLPEMLLVFLALFILLGTGEKWLLEHKGFSYNFLLTALVIGGVFANVAIDPERLANALRTIGTPIFAGFFVMAGFSLHLSDLRHMGWVGGIYIICRIVAKWLGCRFGVRWAGHPDRAEGRLGTALLCQAAVVIGLASFIEHNWKNQLATQFATVVLGSVVVFELVGPLLVKRCAVQGGEVKAITLLRRTGASTEGVSIVRLTLQSMLRLFRRTAPARSDKSAPVSVEHIMRTNVQLLDASTTFDEVLHFIERSTYSHFPVVQQDGSFVGVVHFSDVRDVIYDPMMKNLVTAEDLADTDSAVVSVDMNLDELLDVFTKENVGVLPVVEKSDSRQIVGVVEQRDLLRALHLPPK